MHSTRSPATGPNVGRPDDECPLTWAAGLPGMSNITLPLADLYAPIQGDMDRVVEILDAEIASDLPFVNQLCATVQGYRGKMLRPALLLLTGEALGSVTPAHHTLAAVVELVHMATLVYDDVLDEADMRRRRPTVNALTNNEAAVMLGDYLISHAFHLCSSLDSQYASRLIGSTTNTVCEGELMQIHHRGSHDLCAADYFEIIRRKTAALTGAACTLGAKYAAADARTVVALGSFGVQAGMAFQIVDDVLDLVGAEDRVGKTLGRDLELGKLTLPLIHYLGHVDSVRRGALLDMLRQTTDRSRAEIADLLRESGSMAYALSIAEDYVRKALAELTGLPETPAKTSLAAMAEFIVRRDL